MKRFMTIKTFFRLVLGSIFALLSALAVMAGMLVLHQRQTLSDQKTRQTSYVLVDQLRQTGDDLARFARTYVVTGDPKFKQYYQDTLEIRNGTKRLPPQYIGRVFWEFVIADEKAYVLEENPLPVPLYRLTQDLGFSTEERAKLEEAEDESDHLVQFEQMAIRTLQKAIDEFPETTAGKNRPGQAIAMQLMYSQEYYSHRARMMKPINEVLSMLEARTQSTVELSRQRGRNYLIVILGLIVVLLALVLFGGYIIFKRVCEPIISLQHQTRLVGDDLKQLANVATELAHGNLCSSFATRAKFQKTQTTDEIGELSRMHDEMIGSLQAAGIAISEITADLSKRTRLLNRANDELHDVNAGLQAEIAARRKAERRAHQLNDNLEQRVCERTADLIAAKFQIENANSLQRAILDHAAYAIIACETNGTISVFNPAAERLLGYSADEMIGKMTPAVFHLESEIASRAEELSRELGEPIAPGFDVFTERSKRSLPNEAEWTYLRKDGSTFPVLLGIAAIRNHAGEITAYLGIANDITARHNAECELKVASDLLRQFIDHSPAAVAMLDSQMCYLQVSQRWLKDYNLTEQGIIGKSLYDGFAQVPDRWRDMHKRVLQGSIESCDEDPFATANGIVEWLQWEARPWRNSQNQICGVILFTQMITARKQAEEALRRNEMRLREAQRLARVGSWSWDISSDSFTWSEELYNIAGRDPTLPAPSFADHVGLYSDESWQRLELAMENAVFYGTPYEVELQLIRPDGPQRSIISRGEAARDQAGKVVQLFGTVQDVTDLKQARLSIEQISTRLQIATRASGIGIWDWDVVSNSLIWDEVMLRLYGLERNQFSGTFYAWQTAIHSEDRDRVTRKIEEILKSGGELDSTFRINRPNREVRHIRIHGVVHRDPAGAALRMVGTNWDITERVAAEEALQFSRDRFELAARGAVDGIWDWNVVTGEDYFSSRFCELLGYKKNELPARIATWESLLHPSDREHSAKCIREHFEWRVPFDVEYRLRTKAGVYRWFRACGQAKWDANGKPIRMAGSLTDITDRKAAEAELIAARDAATQASRSKSEFLANMSHEIRTPMNGIMGMTQLALDTQLTTEQREYLDTVNSSADSLLRIINDILDFSKIEAGKLELELQSFSLRESLGDAMKTLGFRAHEKNLELVWDTPSDVPDELIGDLGRLRQVLVNLVGNAIKFTETGEVGVSVELVTQNERSAVLRFSVSDTGIGIPQDKQTLIFEAFAQADASTTRVYGGTGLGLSISRQIVKLMGGDISIRSEPGQGSTFHFTIELALSEKKMPIECEFALDGIHVLVVDDNATNRRILEHLLRSWNMQPTLVDSGRAAMEAMRSAKQNGQPFPLVLTDCHMPHMDGFMFVEEFRKCPDLWCAAIVMLTSGDLRDAFDRCHQLKIAATLLKPIKQSELKQTLAAALNSGKKMPTPLADPQLFTVPNRQSEQLRILLAEDNLVNQRVATRMLENMGHSVQVAANGQLALDALEAATFDLVIMDVQMPVMDGMQAVAALRWREMNTDQHMPVIAMTAHAMSGDRERCLAAGMDDYVGKPVVASDLAAALQRVLKRSVVSTSQPIEREPAAITTIPPFDFEAALDRFGGDCEFLKELAGIFLATITDLLVALDSAVKNQNLKEIGAEAHSIKGALGNFCAHPAYEAALQLETLSRDGILENVEQIHAELVHEVERLSIALRKELIEQVPASVDAH
jgi:two-component system sensor histidine kinase/response regulator